jgi:tetratricopeptide (TPR) repeat protein
MSPERWRRIEDLYAASLAHPPADRARLLASWCGDDGDLRRDVEGLLAAYDSDPAFIETPFLQKAAARLAAGYGEEAGTRVVGRCRLDALIGAGGMGEVYRAWDVGLERNVAVKLVRPQDADHPDATTRLLREARTAARLSHPNICSVHEVGEADGFAFVVMELVEGRTLAEIVRGGPLDVMAAARTALQIADALVHAHQRGVLHRDLKSANVMLADDGAAKVLDFGLARRLDTDGVEMLSRASVASAGSREVCGTLAYMAPELLRGEAADVRTDLWALGVMIVEMLTGDLPFTGRSSLEVVSAILLGSLRSLPPGIDPRLEAMVQRCLAKDRADRYQNAQELRDALAAVLPPPATSARVSGSADSLRQDRRSASRKRLAALPGMLVFAMGSVLWLGLSSYDAAEPGAARRPRADLAVLPVQLRGVPGDLQYVSMGITDTITSWLATKVRVRPSPAVASYTGRALTQLKPIGEELRVKHLLTGTLYPSADTYQLHLQLVNSSEETVIWGDHFALAIADLPRFETEITAGVLAALNLRVGQTGDRRTLPRNREAYLEFLRARSVLTGNAQGDPRVAVAAFERVLALEPGFARARAGLAVASARAYWSAEPAELGQWAARAMDAAQHALDLDPTLAEAHQAIASVYRYNESDWMRVIEESRRALELDPSLDVPHENMAVAFYHLGLFDLSAQASRAGVVANPSTRWEEWRNRGRAALYAGRFGEARALLEKARGNARRPGWILAEAHFYTGDEAAAEAALRSIFTDGGAINRQRAGASLAAILAKAGRHREAREFLRQTLDLNPTDHHVTYRIGTAFAQLRERDNAVAWLRRSADTGFPCHGWFAGDPLAAPLRGYLPFGALLTRMRTDTARWERRYAVLYASPAPAAPRLDAHGPQAYSVLQPTWARAASPIP